jgi:hypothetical protein
MDRNPDFTGDYTAYTEWRAWQLVVEQFRKLGLDINEDKFNPLIRCIEAWGELLVELRMDQTGFEREQARQEKLMMALQAVKA